MNGLQVKNVLINQLCWKYNITKSMACEIVAFVDQYTLSIFYQMK